MSQESKDLFFELLLIATGAKKQLSRKYSDQQWSEALVIAAQQTLTGVLVTAIEVIGDKALLPSRPIYMQWLGNSQIVEQKASKMTKAAEAVVSFFHKKGFACQILKGCAVARYYPHPYRRSFGDIDVWVDGGRKKVYDFARSFDKDGMLYGVNYHHVHLHLIKGTHVEVHIWPSYLSSPIRNHRLHQFSNLYRPTMETTMPCLAFDRVFILLHCYQHMSGNGVGLRQVMDYFYVLRQGFTEEERIDTVKWVKKLGMGRFAAGLMWVLRDVFGLEDKYLIMEPDEKEGRFILNEILLTGNMGHSDKRSWGSRKSAFSRFFRNLRRDFYMVRHYPHEALWQPFFSLWLYFWRLSKGLLKDRKRSSSSQRKV